MNFRLKRLNQKGFDHVMVLVVFVVMFALVGTWLLLESHAATVTCVNNTNSGSNRCVNLHVGSTGGYCLNGTTLTKCNNTSNENMWINPTASSFKLENKGGQCLADPGGGVQTKTLAQGGKRVPVSLGSCSAGYTSWRWSSSKLVNTSSGGCVNSAGGTALGSPIIVYSCSGGGSNEIWKSVYVAAASSGGGTAQGGSGNCGGSNGSTVLAQALKFCGFSYASEGHESSGNLWTVACPTVLSRYSGCHVDCSGLVNAATYLATGKWHDWIVDGSGWMDLNGKVDNTDWKAVSVASAKPGDLVMASGHVEMVQSHTAGSGSWASIRTFGAHGAGSPDGNQNTANYLSPIRILHYTQ